MSRESYYRKMFFIGAIWNWVATVTFALAYTFLFPFFGMQLPRYPVLLHLFLALAFVFGIGYYWVSRDIYSNHAIVKLGILGKLLVFVLLVAAWINCNISIFLVPPGIVDLIFAILFVEFLATMAKRQQQT